MAEGCTIDRPLPTQFQLLYPRVRYTGVSLSFNLAGILGASLAPYIATALATRQGIASAPAGIWV